MFVVEGFSSTAFSSRCLVENIKVKPSEGEGNIQSRGSRICRVHTRVRWSTMSNNGAPPWAQSSMGPMMRRRHQVGSSTASGGDRSSDGSGLRALARFDLFARVDDDLAVKTETGAAVTIGFWVLMVVLIVGEVLAFRKLPPSAERVVVNSTFDQRLRINIDLVRQSRLVVSSVDQRRGLPTSDMDTCSMLI